MKRQDGQDPESGGFNVGNSCGQPIDPESIKAVEVGVKSRWLDGALTANAAVFHYDYDDYQIDRVVGLSVEIVNAAKASTLGAEIETSYAAADWLTLDARASYLDAEFDEYFQADPFRNSSGLAGDAPTEDLSGKRLNRSPKYTLGGGVSLEDTFALTRFASRARLRVEGFYSDEFFFREFNRPEDRQEAYGTLDAFAEVRWWDDHMGLRFVAKNLTDTRYLAGLLPLGTFYYRGGYYAPPRTFGAALDWVW